MIKFWKFFKWLKTEINYSTKKERKGIWKDSRKGISKESNKLNEWVNIVNWCCCSKFLSSNIQNINKTMKHVVKMHDNGGY